MKVKSVPVRELAPSVGSVLLTKWRCGLTCTRGLLKRSKLDMVNDYTLARLAQNRVSLEPAELSSSF